MNTLLQKKVKNFKCYGFPNSVYPELAEQPDFIERESNNMPANFACFLAAAEFQPIGLWSYHRDQLWKQEGYDLKAEKLFADNLTKD